MTVRTVVGTAPPVEVPVGVPVGVPADVPVDVSVVICAYTMDRWGLLLTAVDSVETQSFRAVAPRTGRGGSGSDRVATTESGRVEIVIVVDHSPQLLECAQREWPNHIVTANASERGLSGARNTGVAVARGAIVAFLDDDARAEPGWLDSLVRHFDAADVWGVGGHVEPHYLGADPDWLPDEFGWVVGCSYRGQPTTVAEVRNPIGANMAFRRSAFDAVGGFRDGIGRVGRTPLGCEETEFAIRVRAQGGRVLHDPGARVRHSVSGDRARWRYFVRRCWAEGVSKAIVSGLAGSTAALSSERSYVVGVLPAALWRALHDAVVGPRRRSAMARAVAVVTGVTVTAAGFVRGRVAASFREGRR